MGAQCVGSTKVVLVRSSVEEHFILGLLGMEGRS